MHDNLVISENCCNFIVLKYKELQTIIAMITEDKVTELFCIADDFCKFFDAMMEKYTLKADKKRQYHRKSTMSKAEIMVIMILFHDSGYRCLKHFYIEKVCRHMRHLFPKVVSYNRWSSESRSQTCLDYAEISCKREQSQACLAFLRCSLSYPKITKKVDTS